MAYIISLHNKTSIVAISLAYTANQDRFTRIIYTNVKGRQCFVPRWSLVGITDMKGNPMPYIHNEPIGKALSHGRPNGSFDWDISLNERPESIGITNHQIAMKQALVMRQQKALSEREYKERNDLQERLKWADW